MSQGFWMAVLWVLTGGLSFLMLLLWLLFLITARVTSFLSRRWEFPWRFLILCFTTPITVISDFVHFLVRFQASRRVRVVALHIADDAAKEARVCRHRPLHSVKNVKIEFSHLKALRTFLVWGKHRCPIRGIVYLWPGLPRQGAQQQICSARPGHPVQPF